MFLVEVTDDDVTVGNGLIAQQKFQKGALILEQDPILLCNTRKPFETWDREANIFYDEEAAGTTAILATAYSKLSWEDQGAFRELYTSKTRGTDVEHIVDRCRYNAFRYRLGTDADATTRMAVYRTISFANHSCIPNAVVYINKSNSYPRGQARLVATRDIPSGDEILINYIPEAWQEGRATRQAKLMLGWGFDCCCEACGDDDLEPDTSERTLCRWYDTWQDGIIAARFRIHIAILHELGIRDKALSSAFLQLRHRHFGVKEYKEAVRAALSGLLVEQHFYQKVHNDQLLSLYSDCALKDNSMHPEHQ
ncbi:uncharacterized protein J4E88_000042 [Alternaria novae-zelandiae]|uniref:uncharacterized protein n=1 Tax=Alternaria novae-zelandiae TaxID=430562 RepID=UPI0020C4049A|nr:uncharacterized protein J4E88_000042 [Alternaria novae-zelandiae]KAI4695872.1 hypothetical protein J4E88_000042 [Alternaria novae-zelandiae]